MIEEVLLPSELSDHSYSVHDYPLKPVAVQMETTESETQSWKVDNDMEQGW